MTSVLSQVTRSSSFCKPSTAAQDLIKQKSVCKNGVLRKKGKKLNIGRWPHRFVVLTNDMVYIYSNESSKAPKSKFSLVGYNRVSRCEAKGQDWCFSVLPASSGDAIKAKTFACFSDAERKAWMYAIKNQIYNANNIPKPVRTNLDIIKLMSIDDNDEEDYLDVERQVFEGGDGPAVDPRSDNDEEDDSSLDSGSEGDSHVIKKTRSMSVPSKVTMAAKAKNSFRASKGAKGSESLEVSEPPSTPDIETSEEVFDDINRQFSKRKLPPVPQSQENLSRPPSEEAPHPPRYSEICKEAEIFEEPDYVNFTSIKMLQPPPIPRKKVLEPACTITNMSLTREQMLDMLKAKREPGTYLMRKSRKDDSKVLAFLGPDGEVVEYKILGELGKYRLDDQAHFSNIEELLIHYTSVSHLPGKNSFLVKGFHQA